MPKGYHHLTCEQRCQIYVLKKRGDTISAIAKLRVLPVSVRELVRGF